MRVWRMSLRRTKSVIISWAGSFVKSRLPSHLKTFSSVVYSIVIINKFWKGDHSEARTARIHGMNVFQSAKTILTICHQGYKRILRHKLAQHLWKCIKYFNFLPVVIKTFKDLLYILSRLAAKLHVTFKITSFLCKFAMQIFCSNSFSDL